MGNAPEDHGSGALDDFEALLQELGVSMPKLDIVGASGPGLKSYGLADDESHGLGFGLAYLLCGQSTAFASMQHLMRLCCRQHKRTYVAKRFMWRSLRDARRDAGFDTDQRHIT